MPNKPIKKGFKIWCCSCSCCGYLCTFQVYHGSHVDAFSGKKVPEKGLAKRVVLDLTAPFVGVNHVVYCDNFYSSGPLADALAKDKIFITGTIKKNASGFPDSLKSHKPPQYRGPLVHFGSFAAWPFAACLFGAWRLAVWRVSAPFGQPDFTIIPGDKTSKSTTFFRFQVADFKIYACIT